MTTFYDQVTRNKIKTLLLFLIFPFLVILILWVIVEYYGDPNSFILYSVFALFFSLLYGTIAYFNGDKIVLFMNGAKEITQENNKRVYRIVENLCITTGMPAPKIYEIPDTSLNAFATGRNPKNSSIAFSTGIMEKLNDRELAGVAAHELSHIKNYDILVMIIALVMVNVIQLLAELLFRTVLWGGNRRGSGDRKGNMAYIYIAAILLYIVGGLIAILVQKSISRKREFIADSNAALITRDPQALADALRKVSQDARIEAIDGKRSFASLYIANPLQEGWFERLFSTHPPIEKRIEILEKMGNA
jgi:heat shock protein HtpX